MTAAQATPASPDAKGLAEAHTVAILAYLVGAPLLLVLASFPGEPFPGLLPVAGRVAVALAMSAALFRLARALGEPGPWLWAVAPLVHFMLDVVVFALLSARARRRLRLLGLDVGVLGARNARPAPPGGSPSGSAAPSEASRSPR